MLDIPDSDTDIENNISKEAHMIKINLADEQLKWARDTYAIPTTPYVEVYNGDELVFEEVPDQNTEDKIRSIVTINKQQKQEEEKVKEGEISVSDDWIQAQPDEVVTRGHDKDKEDDSGNRLNIIQTNPNAEFKLGGWDPPENVNPLIYSGSASSYLDPRDNANYYSEDIY